jgi:hypothetical protein
VSVVPVMTCPACGTPLETQPLAVSGVHRHWCPSGSVWGGDTQEALSFVVASSNCCNRARQNTDAAMATSSSRINCASESAAPWVAA